MNYGESAKAHRLRLGMSVDELSELSGVSVQTIYNFESGKKGTSLTVAVQLADALGVSLDYLIGRTGVKQYGSDIGLIVRWI